MAALRVVIVGNGIAGIMTASRLRALEPDPAKVSILICTRESSAYYARVRLPEVLATGITVQELEVYKPGWYEQKLIQVSRSQEVVSVDRAARQVRTASGAVLPYDALVLCTGADSFRPPIANADLAGVFTIREYGDAEAIRRYLQEGTRHAVVVGGGLLGLEAAQFLQVPGVESVTIVEIMPRLLPRQLDEAGSRLLQRLLEAPGRRVILGVEVREFVGDGRVRGLRLSDGREIPAETVLFSAGISPRVPLAREAGLPVRKGIIVDERMGTADPRIWAVGDCAEFGGIVWGIIPAALEQAPVAAAAILGRPGPVYRQTIPQNALKVAGITVASFGTVAPGPAEEAAHRVIARTDEAAGRYEKYVLKDGVLVGCILLGSKANQGWVTPRMGTPVTEEEIAARLW